MGFFKRSKNKNRVYVEAEIVYDDKLTQTYEAKIEAECAECEAECAANCEFTEQQQEAIEGASSQAYDTETSDYQADIIEVADSQIDDIEDIYPDLQTDSSATFIKQEANSISPDEIKETITSDNALDEMSTQLDTENKAIEEEKAVDLDIPKGFFVLSKQKDKICFDLMSADNKYIASSIKSYTDYDECNLDILSIQESVNGKTEDQTLQKVTVQKLPKWEIFAEGEKSYIARLVDKSGEPLLSSKEYKTKAACKNCIKSAQEFAPNADIKNEI